MGMVGSEKNKYLKPNMSKDVQKAWPMFAQKPPDDWAIMIQLVESIDQLTASSDGAVGNLYQRT